MDKPRKRKQVGGSVVAMLGILFVAFSEACAQEKGVFESEKAILKGHRTGVTCIAFAPDGKKFASCESGEVRIWDSTNLEGISSFADLALWRRIAFSPNGRLLAVTGNRAPARLYDTSTWQVKHKLGESEETTRSIAFSDDGKIVATAALDDAVHFWNTLNGKLIESLDPGFARLSKVGFSPDGKSFATSGDGHAILWDWPTKKVRVKLEGHKRNVHQMAFSLDSKTLVTLEHDFKGPVSLWDPATGKNRGQVDLTDALVFPAAAAFSPDNRTLAVVGHGYVLLFDVVQNRRLARLKGTGGQFEAVAFFPDGKQLIAGSADRTLRVFDVPKFEMSQKKN